MTSEASDTHGEPKPPRDDDAARSHDRVAQPPDDTSARPTLVTEDSAAQPNRASAPPAPEPAPEPAAEPAAVSGDASGDGPSDEGATRPTAPAGDAGNALRLQPRLMPRADGLYYVSEILNYHDEAFVEAAYASVLRRPPAEEEFRQTLADLRGGAREKIDILRDLARTNEGKTQLAFERIAGLRQSPLARFARSVPVVGHLWQILAALVRLPTALRHQRQFEAYALAQQQLIADHVNTWGAGDAALGLAASELRQSVADASAAVSMLSDAMAEMAARHADERSRLTRQLEHAAHRHDEAERRLDKAEHRFDEAERRLDEHGRWIDEAGRGFAEHGRMFDEHARRLDAQQEFLIREQQAIVEAQKATLADAEERLRETTAEQRRELAALAARLEELRAAIDAERAIGGGKV